MQHLVSRTPADLSSVLTIWLGRATWTPLGVGAVDPPGPPLGVGASGLSMLPGALLATLPVGPLSCKLRNIERCIELLPATLVQVILVSNMGPS